MPKSLLDTDTLSAVIKQNPARPKPDLGQLAQAMRGSRDWEGAGMGLLQWETIDTINTGQTITQQYIYITRARVPGGWLVMAYAGSNMAGVKTAEQDVSVTFVPDPAHSWGKGSAP